jgi:hypothetical protein
MKKAAEQLPHDIFTILPDANYSTDVNRNKWSEEEVEYNPPAMRCEGVGSTHCAVKRESAAERRRHGL